MRRQQRLCRSQDFAAVHQEGRGTSNNLLVVRTRPNALGHNRYGFVVGKRVGGAVVRNGVKRRLRAVVDQLAPDGSLDVVLIARAPIVHVDYDELVQSVTHLFRRARLLPRAPAASAAMGAGRPPGSAGVGGEPTASA